MSGPGNTLRPPWHLESDGKGVQIRLGEQLGRGGEARVYGIEGRHDLVAKLYLEPGPEREAKLRAMLASVPEDPGGTTPGAHTALAWPRALVVDANGRVGGFAMPRLDTRETRPLHQIYHPRSRRETAPGFSWRHLVRVSRNLSATVAALHAASYVVGDLNESNIMVSRRALVSLIDLDSIQVRDGRTVHRCVVGKLEYTAPELLGKSFRTLNRRPSSDVFALAVLVFQLLMEGAHPFAGVWRGAGDPPGLEANIRNRRSPWFGSRHLDRPPAAPPASLLSPQLRRLLNRALISPGFARPSAADLQRALDRLERSLVTCTLNPQHLHPKHLRRCPWCERAKLLGVDPFASR